MSADTFFYKYTDAKGAKKILGDLKILYTAPGKFNDPFDCKIALRVDYDHEKFGPLLIAKLFQLLWSTSRPELLIGRPVLVQRKLDNVHFLDAEYIQI